MDVAEFGVSGFGGADVGVEADGFVKLKNFAACEVTEGSHGEGTEGDGADLGAFELEDGVADGFAEAAEDAVAAFVDVELEPGVAASEAEGADAVGFHEAVVEGDAVAQALHDGAFVVDFAFEFDLVDTEHLFGGVHECVGEVAVVGEEESAFAVPVEAADGVDAGHAFGEEVGDDGAVGGVIEAGDVADGFVEEDVGAFGLPADGFSVDFDAGAARGDFGAEGIDDATVNGDAALEDEFFGFAAAAVSGEAEVALEANGILVFVHELCGVRLGT